MNNLLYYFLYLVYLTAFIFITYVLISVNNFSIFLSVIILIGSILLFCDFGDNSGFISNFFELSPMNQDKQLSVNKERNRMNFVLIIKQISIVILLLILYNFNLLDVLLIILIFDFLVKITFDNSLIEFYLNRKINV